MFVSKIVMKSAVRNTIHIAELMEWHTEICVYWNLRPANIRLIWLLLIQENAKLRKVSDILPRSGHWPFMERVKSTVHSMFCPIQVFLPNDPSGKTGGKHSGRWDTVQCDRSELWAAVDEEEVLGEVGDDGERVISYCAKRGSDPGERPYYQGLFLAHFCSNLPNRNCQRLKFLSNFFYFWEMNRQSFNALDIFAWNSKTKYSFSH